MHRGNDLGRSRIGFDLLAQLGAMLIEARSQLQECRLRLLHLLNPGEEGSYDRRIVTTSAPEQDHSKISPSG
ncbi:MAG: hypothetical protein PWP34_1979 [Desulfuromonadales bacterium]|jgi:hypothetical protein|nr:hypothetical protein [Desulfuromonadales bacterium]